MRELRIPTRNTNPTITQFPTSLCMSSPWNILRLQYHLSKTLHTGSSPHSIPRPIIYFQTINQNSPLSHKLLLFSSPKEYFHKSGLPQSEGRTKRSTNMFFNNWQSDRAFQNLVTKFIFNKPSILKQDWSYPLITLSC